MHIMAKAATPHIWDGTEAAFNAIKDAVPHDHRISLEGGFGTLDIHSPHNHTRVLHGETVLVTSRDVCRSFERVWDGTEETRSWIVDGTTPTGWTVTNDNGTLHLTRDGHTATAEIGFRVAMVGCEPVVLPPLPKAQR